MSMFIKDGGAWVEVQQPSIKSGSSFFDAQRVWVKQGGDWHLVFGDATPEIAPSAKWSGLALEFDADGSYLSDIGTK